MLNEHDRHPMVVADAGHELAELGDFAVREAAEASARAMSMRFCVA